MVCGVDATKLNAAKGGKEVRKGGFDRVVFNFPHVGGKTRDVNRQVRYNQGVRFLRVTFSCFGSFGRGNLCFASFLNVFLGIKMLGFSWSRSFGCG